MAPRSSPKSAPAPGSAQYAQVEFGATGLRQFSGYVREEWLRELTGWRGRRVLREMEDNDPIIGSFMFAITMLLRSVPFRVEPVGESPDDKAAAEFVKSCLGDMEQAWSETISQILTLWSSDGKFPKIVYKIRQGASDDPRTNSQYSDGMWGWRKFADRAQETLLHWEFDESGDAIAMHQLLPTGGPILRVPLSKCLHFKTIQKKNNPEARSIFRNAYRPWFFKKRIEEIEAVGIERDLSGLPVAWVPAKLLTSAATNDEKAQLAYFKKMVRDTTRGEQEGFVLPLAYDGNGNKQYDYTLLTTGGRRQIDTTGIIDRYDHRICATVLADFITLGAGGIQSRGSYAQSKNKTDMFMLAVIGFVDIMTGQMNRKAIPDLLRMNAMKGQCAMHHGDIASQDLASLGSFVTALTGAGIPLSDPETAAHLREEGGLPVPTIGDLDSLAQAQQSSGKDNNANDPAASSSGDAGAGQGRTTKKAPADLMDPYSRRQNVGQRVAPGGWQSCIAKATDPTEAKYQWLHDIADKAAPAVAEAFRRAIALVRGTAKEAALIKAVETGSVEAVLAVLDIDKTVAAALSAEIAPPLEDAFIAAGRAAPAKILPTKISATMRFDIANPKSIQFLREYDMGLIRQISQETRDGVRQVVRDAFQYGGHPYEQARRIRELVGLTQNQAAAVDSYRALLEERDAGALQRGLRDRRFDPTVARAVSSDTPLSQDQIDTMVTRYGERMLDMRAENIARTETLRASNAGNDLAWQQASEKGFLDVTSFRRQWLVTPDDRLCPYCEAVPGMNPDGARLGEFFDTPLGAVLRPPLHPSCRCVLIVSAF